MYNLICMKMIHKRICNDKVIQYFSMLDSQLLYMIIYILLFGIPMSMILVQGKSFSLKKDF
jgi:hypothetical protein